MVIVTGVPKTVHDQSMVDYSAAATKEDAVAEMIRDEHAPLRGVQWTKRQIEMVLGSPPIAVNRIKMRRCARQFDFERRKLRGDFPY